MSIITQETKTFPETNGSGPLHHTYYFMQDLSFKTVVTGPERSTAAVTVQTGTKATQMVPLWTTTLDAGNLVHTTKKPIDANLPVYGNVIIDTGATFTLTVPTASKDGKVVFNGVVTSNPSSQPFNFTLFSWPLSSLSE